MNKLQQWREQRFHQTVGPDPMYYRGIWKVPCVARVSDPAECPVGAHVVITGTPYRVFFIVRRGFDQFNDGGVFYCYGVQCGPYRQRTRGKYLRRLKEGPCDPTMTHMEDPYAVKVGDYIRDAYGLSRVVAIRDEVYPDTRFAYVKEQEMPPPGAVVWDVREQPKQVWFDVDPTMTVLRF